MKNEIDRLIKVVGSKPIDWDKYWSRIPAVQKKVKLRDVDKFFDLSLSNEPKIRKIVPDVLRYANNLVRAHKKIEKLFVEMLEVERSPGVISSIGFANIDFKSPLVAKAMLRSWAHKSPQVRLSVIRANDSFPSREFLEVLFSYASDKSAQVRSWAIFTIGNSFISTKIFSRKDKLRFLKLLNVLVRDPNSNARAEAKSALEEISK